MRLANRSPVLKPVTSSSSAPNRNRRDSGEPESGPEFASPRYYRISPSKIRDLPDTAESKFRGGVFLYTHKTGCVASLPFRGKILARHRSGPAPQAAKASRGLPLP
jgi:hypothetical protein